MFSLNNKGQSLVLFIVIIPILLFIVCLVYDVGNAIYEKNNLDNVNYMAIDYALSDIDKINSNDIKLFINSNSDDVDSVLISITDSSVSVKLNKKIDSVIGNLFDFNIGEITSEYRGKINNNKKEIERVK